MTDKEKELRKQLEIIDRSFIIVIPSMEDSELGTMPQIQLAYEAQRATRKAIKILEK